MGRLELKEKKKQVIAHQYSLSLCNLPNQSAIASEQNVIASKCKAIPIRDIFQRTQTKHPKGKMVPSTMGQRACSAAWPLSRLGKGCFSLIIC